jgi:alpha-amylase/alpha-mannosidase (GH57 family)
LRSKKLYVAFVWNQHQPYYLDTIQGEFIMPWVRLHASKDYYQMAAILEEYPRIRQTFSLSPSLLDQLQIYLQHQAVDYYLKVMKRAEELNEAEKKFILQHYFDIQWERVVSRYDRYHQLLKLQGFVTEPGAVARALQNYTTQDYLDLQVWFNLVWIDPEIREKDSFLRGLIEKGHNFTESEKDELMRRQFSILEKIIPLHSNLQQKGQIEIITTAYYHPILPLLIDNHSALRSSPGLPLPGRFRFKKDAEVQVRMAVEHYTQIFGRKPLGFWPPEQAISPETIPIIVDQGLTWTTLDEQALVKSIGADIYRDEYGHVLNPDLLYRPYLVSGEGAEIPVIFRDHNLSDRIGFVYKDMSGEDAANDLIHRLHKIKEKLNHTAENHLVTIALDGENAWEWYHGEKTEFLHALYSRLSVDPDLETITVSDFLEKNPPQKKISHLATGSWVDHSLTRWIGTPNKNKIWDYLLEARETIRVCQEKGFEVQKIEKAYENIYQAEGSDFPWWVDSMPYYLAAPFEALFRKHLLNVYRDLDLEPPPYLHRPIIEPQEGEKKWEGSSLAGPVCIVPGWHKHC